MTFSVTSSPYNHKDCVHEVRRNLAWKFLAAVNQRNAQHLATGSGLQVAPWQAAGRQRRRPRMLSLFSRGARTPTPSGLHVLVFPVAPLPAGCRLPVNMRGSQKGATAIGGAEPGLPSAKLWSCQLLVQCELDFGATAGSEAFVP